MSDSLTLPQLVAKLRDTADKWFSGMETHKALHEAADQLVKATPLVFTNALLQQDLHSVRAHRDTLRTDLAQELNNRLAVEQNYARLAACLRDRDTALQGLREHVKRVEDEWRVLRRTVRVMEEAVEAFHQDWPKPPGAAGGPRAEPEYGGARAGRVEGNGGTGINSKSSVGGNTDTVATQQKACPVGCSVSYEEKIYTCGVKASGPAPLPDTCPRPDHA